MKKILAIMAAVMVLSFSFAAVAGADQLDEIKERCDTLTVLRDGHIIRTFEKEEYDDDAIRTSMIRVFWVWFTSVVMRVTREAVENLSISLIEKLRTFL